MKKEMVKRLLCIILSALLAAGAGIASLTAFAKDETVKFAVSTDIHIENNKTELDVNYPESELYFQASGSGNIYDQAAEITRDFLRKSAGEGAQFILIAGDLTRGGNEIQHRYVSSLFADFEKETGIQIYIVPGNHDYYDSATTRSIFREYYYDFGYDEALAEDKDTASYTADICDGYRLIAVDSNDPGNDGDGITDSLLAWIEEQASQAHKDGREIIYMMHHSLLEHLYMGKLLMKDFVVRDSEKIAEKFAQWGIQYVFTGHEHGNDVAGYTGKNGAAVYDVLTTALSTYPLEYRFVTMTDKGADLKMRKIEECNLDELIDGYTDKQKALLESDYEEFARGLFRYSVEKKILKFVTPDFIKGKLKVTDGPLADTVDNLFNAVGEALTMPLYDTGGGVSMEKLAASKGVKIPQSDYGSLIELASAVVAVHYYGDEHLVPGEAPEFEILIKGLNTGLEYILTKTGRSGLNKLLEIIGTQVETDELSPLFNAVSLGKEESYSVAERVLYPLLGKFGVDSGLADRDVFLPSVQAESAEDSSPSGFFGRIIEFIRRIFNMIFRFA